MVSWRWLCSSALHPTQHFKIYIRHRHLAPHRLGGLSCRVRVKWWSLGKVLLGSIGSKPSACHSVFCGTPSCWSMKWVRLVSWLDSYTLYTVIPCPCMFDIFTQAQQYALLGVEKGGYWIVHCNMVLGLTFSNSIKAIRKSVYLSARFWWECVSFRLDQREHG